MEQQKQQELLNKFVDKIKHQVSRQATKQYLFKMAQGFLKEKFGAKIDRHTLRTHARVMANRLAKTVREETNAESV